MPQNPPHPPQNHSVFGAWFLVHSLWRLSWLMHVIIYNEWESVHPNKYMWWVGIIQMIQNACMVHTHILWMLWYEFLWILYIYIYTEWYIHISCRYPCSPNIWSRDCSRSGDRCIKGWGLTSCMTTLGRLAWASGSCVDQEVLKTFKISRLQTMEDGESVCWEGFPSGGCNVPFILNYPVC